MVVGTLVVDIVLGDVASLKQKRSVVRPLVAELRRRFEVAAAETGHLDLHRRAEISVAVVSSTHAHARAVLDNCERLVAGHPEFTLLSAPAAGARRRRSGLESEGASNGGRGTGPADVGSDQADRGLDARDAGQGPAAGHGHDHRCPADRRPARRHVFYTVFGDAEQRASSAAGARLGHRRAAQRGRPADRRSVHPDAGVRPRRPARSRPTRSTSCSSGRRAPTPRCRPLGSALSRPARPIPTASRARTTRVIFARADRGGLAADLAGLARGRRARRHVHLRSATVRLTDGRRIWMLPEPAQTWLVTDDGATRCSAPTCSSRTSPATGRTSPMPASW